MIQKNAKSGKSYLFDCEKFILGRLASKAAFLLQGKNKPGYTPNKDGDCSMVFINSDKLKVTGRKKHEKMYHSFSGYPGGISSRNLDEAIKKDSRKVVRDAVYGMLPKNKLRDQMMKKITILKDDKYSIPNADIEEVQ